MPASPTIDLVSTFRRGPTAADSSHGLDPSSNIAWPIIAFGIISCLTGGLYGALLIVNPGLGGAVLNEASAVGFAARSFALVVGLAIALYWRRPVILALMFGLGIIREAGDGMSAFVTGGSPALLPIAIAFIVAEVLCIRSLLRLRP